jgi:hypothetical protein
MGVLWTSSPPLFYLLYGRGTLLGLGQAFAQAFVQAFDINQGDEQEQATKSSTNTDARFCTYAQT